MGEKGKLLLVECVLIKAEELYKQKDHHWATIRVVVDLGRSHLRMLKLVELL